MIRLGFSCMLPPFGAVPLSVPETLGHYCQKARVLGTKARAVRCTKQWIGRVETKRCAHTPSSLRERPVPHQALGWECRDA